MRSNLRRWLALTRKEFQQLKKNRRLLVQLVLPPTFALMLFGFALDPNVKGLRLGVADYSQTQASRDLVSRLTANEAFTLSRWYLSSTEATAAIGRKDLDAVVVIPRDYAQSIARGQQAEVQVILDAVNANSASIGAAYLKQSMLPVAAVDSRAAILYNPGGVHAWFFLTGVLSVMLFINAALVSSALTVREKELGTIEQLLMSPAQTAEVLLAKTAPVVMLMMIALLMGMAMSITVFDLPQRGSWVLLLFATALASVAGIGIGITIATFCENQQQAQLLTFFMMPPLVLISGAVAPIESMPDLLQALSVVDPLRYMAQLVRGIVLKGWGVAELWRQLAALATFSVVLFGVSAWRFRGQLR